MLGLSQAGAFGLAHLQKLTDRWRRKEFESWLTEKIQTKVIPKAARNSAKEESHKNLQKDLAKLKKSFLSTIRHQGQS